MLFSVPVSYFDLQQRPLILGQAMFIKTTTLEQRKRKTKGRSLSKPIFSVLGIFSLLVLTSLSQVFQSFKLYVFLNDLVYQIYGFGSIDLKGMQADNLCYVVPPTSRSTNSIALKFSDSSSGFPVRLLCCFVFKP